MPAAARLGLARHFNSLGGFSPIVANHVDVEMLLAQAASVDFLCSAKN
jgi:hypothetical protein